MTTKKQRKSIGASGSFFNWVMANNSTLPEVGKGATHLMWSDRHAYEVIEVGEDGSSCVIERYAPERIDKNGMSDAQSYNYEKLTGQRVDLVWRKKKGGCWCQHWKEVRIIPKFLKELESKSTKHFYGDMIMEVYGQDLYDQIYKNETSGYTRALNLVDGVTKEYDVYTPFNVIFGVKREYYDFSF